MAALAGAGRLLAAEGKYWMRLFTALCPLPADPAINQLSFTWLEFCNCSVSKFGKKRIRRAVLMIAWPARRKIRLASCRDISS